MRRLVISLVCLAGWLAATDVLALTVSGTVTDAAGPPVPVGGLRVTIFNENIFPIPDFQIDNVFASAAGVYTTASATNGDDVYVIAKWEWAITASTNNSVIRLMDCTGCAPAVASFTQTRQPASGSIGNITTNQTINVTMGQIQPANLPNLSTRLNHVLSYVNSNAPPVAWSANYDIPIRLTGGPAFASEEVNTPIGSLTGNTFDWVTMYHELGHKIHWELNGNSFPATGAGCVIHTVNSEETKECALVEGWATYVGQRAAETAGAGAVADPFYTSYRDPTNSLWRGDEATPTGRDVATWESGEGVEGTNAAVMFAAEPTVAFSGSLKALDANPNDMYSFFRNLVSDAGGSGTAATLAINTALQTHGIVYSRVRLESGLSNIFDEDAPPNDAASIEPGNVKEINMAVFARGALTVNFDTVPAADLGVSNTIGIDEIRVGWGAAIDATTGGPAAITSSTPFAGYSVFNDDVALDTKTMGGAAGDGDWDLVAVGKNADGFTDSLLPTWVGDGNPVVSQDELYLKVLGAWFDLDRDPSTNTIKGGKVIVDNTAPKVKGCKPQNAPGDCPP